MACPVAAQGLSEEEARRLIAEVHASHIEGNVPEARDFARILERDLNGYFESRGLHGAATRFELLREGPTQIGISYPKFYLWVWVSAPDGTATSGAVPVAAMEKVRFHVGGFLSAPEIVAEPDRVTAVFPAALAQRIRERAASDTPRPPE